MPYWIQSMLAATPALAWMFLGLGLPWALVILPRRDWRDWPTVACLTLAFGSALLTAWMFILGTLGAAFPMFDGGKQFGVGTQPFLTMSLVMAGTMILALIGWVRLVAKLDWLHQRRLSAGIVNNAEVHTAILLRFDEKLLLALIGIALVIRWVGIAYWPSTAYDALWVYAYEGKLYTLLGYIPHTISYYPQFLPLQHTFLQLAVGGVDDHAARAVLPWLHLGSIFAAYVLGKRLFNRRTGIYLAAIWALYPHVGEWSRFGDLEIPVAFLFTSAAAFFLEAWRKADSGDTTLTRRYAIIAGLLLGVGMWTKPTMGAFIWGVILLVIIEVIRRGIQLNAQTALPNRIREALQTAWPRIQVAIWAGLFSILLGAAWYVRNVLNGYNPIDLPPGYWQSLAARSGVEFGWPLLALLILLAYLGWNHYRTLPKTGILIGLLLVLTGLLPSIYNTGRIGITDNRMGIFEWLALGAGTVVLFVSLWRWTQNRWTDESRSTASAIGWALALALPYFVTWFYSYSYHYRLSFAIVPLMILPTAVILARWTEKSPVTSRQLPEKTIQSGSIWRTAWLIVILALAIPGIVAPLYDVNAGWDWLWTDKLPDDHARYESGNVALMSVVDGLQIYKNEHPDNPMSVVASGIKRLPFFFPLDDIRVGDAPTDLKALENITYFVYGTPETGGDFSTLIPGHNPVFDVLSIATNDESDFKSVLRRAWWKDDGIFKYTVYELHLDQRWEKPAVTIPPEGDVVFGGFVRYLGYDILDHSWWHGRKLVTNFFWEVLAPPPADYVVYIHLLDSEGNLYMTWDAPITRSDDGNYYSSLVWTPGEYIIDRRILTMTSRDVPIAEGYHIDIGLYDRNSQERVPMTIDGKPAGDGFTLAEPFAMVPGEE